MKKKLLAGLLVATMTASIFSGCGSDAVSTGNSTSTDNSTTVVDEKEVPVANLDPATEGKVLNIRAWNTEFQDRLKAHYPGYVEVDGTHGMIGDVEVVWSIEPSDENNYQNKLDDALYAQETAAADEKVDLFLVEADYALKYVDTDYTMPIASLGITEEDTANQYAYTKSIVTDSNGVLKGLSWQGCPGILFYNREAAKEVFGTDDAETVQSYVSDWDKFIETAALVKEKGYNMTATTNDTYRVYSNNVSSKWVEDGKLNIDTNLMKWVEDSKKLVDAGATTSAELWSADWKAGFYPEGKVFCYFGPAWLINFCMAADDATSIAAQGGWGAAVGPQSFYWGGTWICAATGTDNASLIADIMKTITCTTDVMKDIVLKENDFVNDKPAMDAMAAADSTYTAAVLGGINPLPMYCEGVEKIDLSNLSAYDQGCNEAFQKALKNYFDNNATLDEALAMFEKTVKETYPELN